MGMCYIISKSYMWYLPFFNSRVWEWPASERTPAKCKFDGTEEPGCWPGDANVELKQMGLQADDVFRLVEMTIFLVILMPISVRWFASRWHAATKLHRLIKKVRVCVVLLCVMVCSI